MVAANEFKDLREDVSDQKIKFQILGHLYPEFDLLVTTVSTVDTEADPLSLKEVRDSILQQETTIAGKKARDLVVQRVPPQPVVYAASLSSER